MKRSMISIIRAALIALVLGSGTVVSTVASASAETTIAPGDMTGSIYAVDGCSVSNRQIHTTHQNNVSQTLFAVLRATDSRGVMSDAPWTPVAPQTGLISQDYPVSSLTGTGPWSVELLSTNGDNNFYQIDSVAVSACAAVKPTVTPLTGTCQVQVTPADATVNFALASGKPVTRAVNSTLFATSQATATYTLDVVGSPSKTELRSGFSLKGLVNGLSFSFKIPGTC